MSRLVLSGFVFGLLAFVYACSSEKDRMAEELIVPMGEFSNSVKQLPGKYRTVKTLDGLNGLNAKYHLAFTNMKAKTEAVVSMHKQIRLETLLSHGVYSNAIKQVQSMSREISNEMVLAKKRLEPPLTYWEFKKGHKCKADGVWSVAKPIRCPFCGDKI